MKKIGLWVMVVLLPFLLIGCISSSHSGSTSSADSNVSGAFSKSSRSSSMAIQSSSQESLDLKPTKENSSNNTHSTSETPNPSSRMIIYNANLSIEVKNYNQFQKMIESDVQDYKGYIVSMSQDNNPNQLISHLTIRVPQTHFYTLVNDIKKSSDKINHDQISGQDVTKQYVDLGSQLKAKQLVEDRLKAFMKKATNTTDLLKISDELGQVETDIESIKGQMKYLENQSSLSTITLKVTETKVNVPKLHTQDLNTWQKALKAFMTTIQGITAFCSWLVIFLIGAFPIIVIILVGGILYFAWRKRNKKEK